MKRRIIFYICILVCAFLIGNAKIEQVNAQQTEAYTIENNDYRLNQDYLDFYAVNTNHFEYTNNGGSVSGGELSKAFDRNFSTFFKSAKDNNVADTETGEANFINTITVTFDRAVVLDRLIYGTETGTSRGYPINLNLYYNNGDGFKLIKNYQTSATSSLMIFEFGEEIEMQQLKFEYVKVATNHKWVATAREILFLQPENSSYELYKNMFTDYTQTSIMEELNSYEKLCNFEQSLNKNINFNGENEKIERAKRVVFGGVVFNQKCEFSTNPSASNVIERYGDIAGYCRTNLQMSSFGTNRQVTGIYALAGQQITIFVDGEANDPLPRIRFSQHMGSWRSWLGGEQQLSLGKNIFTVPNFKYSDYTEDVVLGGAIYISNPYTKTEQSQNVKIYIEGGEIFPIFKQNMDEKLYKAELELYMQKLQTDTTIDITEIVTDHNIITIQASKANEMYANYSPAKTVDNWNTYMDKLLEFGGITQDSTSPLFDEKNLHINCNIRIVQPWSGGWMFAAGEHIGVRQTAQSPLVYGSGLGWGVTHEIGHALDNYNRVISETTNNMYSKYNETVIENANVRGNFAQTLSTLSNDLTYSNEPYFVTTKLNYLIWWYIETWQKGFWGNLENCYRGINPTLQEFLQVTGQTDKISQLSPTELQVFYSSIVTGVDMSYYFDRWGYSIKNDTSDPVFKISTASETFNEIMEIAIDNGYIDNSKQYKLWYQNYLAYHNTNTIPIYSTSTPAVFIKSVSKTQQGYNIFINHTDNPNHLGYEILQGNDIDGYKVIGFTYSNTYTDLTAYGTDEVPNYKVVAVDNTYSTSAPSEAKSVTQTSEIVCKIGEVGFTSLYEAVNEANAGDTIKLLKSFDSANIVVNKNLTLVTDAVSDIIISKIEAGNLFYIASGVELTLNGKSTSQIVLDGNNFPQAGALVSVAGVLTAEYVRFENSINTGNGGAIVMQDNSKNSTIKNCVLSNNTATNGGAYCCEYAKSNISFESTIFNNNTSTNDGVIFNKGTLTLENCNIQNNHAQLGTIKNYAGGVIYIYSCEITNNEAKTGAVAHIDGYTVIKDCDILDNTSQDNSSGIYYSSTVVSRNLNLENVTTNSGIIIASGNAVLSKVTYTNSTLQLLGGNVYLKNDCDITTKFIINRANLFVNGWFNNINDCTIELTNFISGMTIFTGDNYIILDNDLNQINLGNQGVNLQLTDNKVIAHGETMTLSLNMGGQTSTYQFNYGDAVLLNYEVEPTKYIAKYVGDEVEYASGEQFVIKNNISLTAIILDKIQIVLNYDDPTQTAIIYCTPYSKVELPTNMNGRIKLVAWRGANGVITPAGESVVITENTQFNALYQTMFKLTLKDNDEIIYTDYYAYGEKVDLSTLNVEQPDYWEQNGEKINNIVMFTDIVCTAGYNKQSSPAMLIVILIAGAVLVLCAIVVIYKKMHPKAHSL